MYKLKAVGNGERVCRESGRWRGVGGMTLVWNKWSAKACHRQGYLGRQHIITVHHSLIFPDYVYIQRDHITFFASLIACHRYKWKCRQCAHSPFHRDSQEPLYSVQSHHSNNYNCQDMFLLAFEWNHCERTIASQIKQRRDTAFCDLKCSGALWVSCNATSSASLADLALLWLCCATDGALRRSSLLFPQFALVLLSLFGDI